jgi:hypothetical protein
MEYLGNCREFGQTTAKIQARPPAPLGARCRAGRDRPSDSDSPFRPRPNYADSAMLYSRPGSKLNSVLAALLFATAGTAQAKIINAASPSFADVSRAVASAVNGDTVIVPAGTAAWSSTLIITKAIQLIGQTTTDSVAGTAVDRTIILDEILPRKELIRISSIKISTTNPLGDPVWRVSGFTFKQGGTSITSGNTGASVIAAGWSKCIRIDHCHFMDNKYQSKDIQSLDGACGVADHNVMEHAHATYCFTSIHNNWIQGQTDGFGNTSWSSPTNFGSADFFFLEDNYIVNQTAPPYPPLPNGNIAEFAGATDDTLGGRWVFRYNHGYNIQPQGHGTQSGPGRGGRAREIYNNDFHSSFYHNGGGTRSGPHITHHNTWDNVVKGVTYPNIKPPHAFNLETYRVFAPYKTGWSSASGSNPVDVNDVTNGTVSPGQPLTPSVAVAGQTFTNGSFTYSGVVNGLYQSGTVSSGSTKSLIDSTKNWTPNMWVGFVVQRVSDSAICYILSNTSNTLTVSYYPTPPSPTWTAGDQYRIRRPLITVDQPSRGVCDKITNGCISSVTGTVTWPRQALEPSYGWNDTWVPDGSRLLLNASLSNRWILKEGRDFFNNTPMPGYKPYIYPHPLVSGVAAPPSPPSAPKNLRITGP